MVEQTQVLGGSSLAAVGGEKKPGAILAAIQGLDTVQNRLSNVTSAIVDGLHAVIRAEPTEEVPVASGPEPECSLAGQISNLTRLLDLTAERLEGLLERCEL